MYYIIQDSISACISSPFQASLSLLHPPAFCLPLPPTIFNYSYHLYSAFFHKEDSKQLNSSRGTQHIILLSPIFYSPQHCEAG